MVVEAKAGPAGRARLASRPAVAARTRPPAVVVARRVVSAAEVAALVAARASSVFPSRLPVSALCRGREAAPTGVLEAAQISQHLG